MDIQPGSYTTEDTYRGRYTVWGPGEKYRVAVWAAGDIAKFSKEGAVFESFGKVRGREGFGRTRYIADAEGNLHCYDRDGVRKCIHPASRKLRILVVR